MEKNNHQTFVISGMSGRFPQSENVDIFWENLIQGKDMVLEDNRSWDIKEFKTPSRTGNIPCLDKFDASFFGVSGTQANTMDPKIRIALEVAYEAIADAGLNLKSLDGARVGVFMSSSFSEASEIWLRSEENANAHYMIGSHPCMLADRISYTFNLTGPSCTMDSACSSSFSALQYAMLALKNGLCESAIVGGANINTLPLFAQAYFKAKMLSADGKCKAFDADCDGYARSEAVVALYICNKVHAKRSYATIAGVKCCNNGFKPEGITAPSTAMQTKLIKELYTETGVKPLDVLYVEAHGPGTIAGDYREITSLARSFCNGRKEPLLVGSVKSNMGHSEPVSGLCGIVKVLLSRREGVIPPNLHYKIPNQECLALVDGTIRVVTEPTPLRGQFVGVNSFGIGGTSAHVILKFDDTVQASLRACDDNDVLLNADKAKWRSGKFHKPEGIPTLILASGRTNEAVEYFLNQAKKYSDNMEFVGLLQELTLSNVPKHDFVGHALITSNGEFEVTLESKKESLKSIWYVYTGLGGQWIGMTKDMIRFKCFKNSMMLSSAFLKNTGVDLKSILETPDLLCLNNLQNAFVAIIACEIALTDMLNLLDMHPNGIFGHSLGEIACGYADGCLTHEQTILVANCRAKGFMESVLPPGTMASVALTWEEAQKRCPSDIFPAIHNAKNNITIGGPTESIRAFVELLTKDVIFAKEVKAAMYAFHTPYVRKSERLMLKMLKEIIPEPKRRSSKWLSSSVIQNKWGSELSTFCSAEYLVNNAISSVYLYEVCQHIPQRALVLEIGPHCFLQSILKQNLMNTVGTIGLMHCKHDNCLYFLKSVGRIFLAGFNFNINALYEHLKFPVMETTPSISPLIKWDHSVSWEVPHHKNELSCKKGTKFVINPSSDGTFSGHVIQNKIIFPATGYIYLVWQAFSKLQSANFDNVPIHVENINFKRMTEFYSNNNLEFNVIISDNTGCFEIVEGNDIVCSGSIRKANTIDQEILPETGALVNKDNILVQNDFYKLLHLKGYDYQDLFRGVQNVDSEGRWAELNWNENWVCFLDTMLQVWILALESRFKELIVPLRLEAVTIYPKTFKDCLGSNLNCVKVSHCKYLNVVQCPGIQICGLTPSTTSSLLYTPSNQAIIITHQSFFPFIEDRPVAVRNEEALELFIGIVVDNSFAISDNTFIYTENLEPSLSACLNFQSIVCSKFELTEHRIIIGNNYEKRKCVSTSIDCKTYDSIENLSVLPPSHLIWTNLEAKMDIYADLLVNNGFLIFSSSNDDLVFNLDIIAKRRTEKENLYLLRKTSSISQARIVSIDMPNFDWVDILKEKLLSSKDECRVHILSMSGVSGIIGLTKTLIKEPGCHNIRCIHIHNSILFDLENNSIKFEVFKKDLVFNVFNNDSWGTYAHLTGSNLIKPRLSEHVYANIQTVGDLSSLCWVENPNKLYQRENIKVHFSSLNFKNVMFATGKLPKTAFPETIQREECILGFEFSGTHKNKRVFGMSFAKCFSSSLDHEPSMMWSVPNEWSLAEASTVAVAYSTVLYAFLIRGKLKQNEIVLIHSGSGAVGLAAITVALDLNCLVFTTVGSNAKREFLKKMFPKLLGENILNSKLGSRFKNEILRQTKGKGVNVVLNSLSGENLKASLDCLDEGGRFLEIGKFDAFNNTSVGLKVLLKNVDIQAIHLDKIDTANSSEQSQVQAIMQDYLDLGKIKPLPYTCFGHENLEGAFKYLTSGTHVGKVIIKVREPSGIASISAIPRTYFYPHKTYLIIGGLGGMGLEIITWMIERGAKMLFIVSRSGVSTSYQKYKLKKWEDMGATVFLKDRDISTKNDVSKLMLEAVAIGPLGGIFNLALVLQDGLFLNQSAQKFEMVSKCKIDASLHLDCLSRLYAPSLDYFVLFSSVSSGRGNPGQSNYAYANSAMERICEQRKFDGLPALAIQWGPVGDVGSVARMFVGKAVINGLLGQPISSCITTLDLLLQQTEAVVGSCVFAEDNEVIVSATSKKVSLAQTIVGILGIQDVLNIDENMTMAEHGMDSIMGAQIQYAINRKTNVYIPASSYGNLTFKDLTAME